MLLVGKVTISSFFRQVLSCIIYKLWCSLGDHFADLNTIAEWLNADQITIAEWARKWYVTLNTEKSTLINCSLKMTRSCPSVSFNNIPVRHVNEHKHLGITLTDRLLYIGQSIIIKYITIRASRKRGVFRRQSCKFLRSKL